jgi:hypothetical protein
VANHDRPRGRAADRGAPVIAEALTGLADVALRRAALSTADYGVAFQRGREVTVETLEAALAGIAAG